MAAPKKITPAEIAEETGVEQSKVKDVLFYLVEEGWLIQRYIDMEYEDVDYSK